MHQASPFGDGRKVRTHRCGSAKQRARGSSGILPGTFGCESTSSANRPVLPQLRFLLETNGPVRSLRNSQELMHACQRRWGVAYRAPTAIPLAPGCRTSDDAAMSVLATSPTPYDARCEIDKKLSSISWSITAPGCRAPSVQFPGCLNEAMWFNRPEQRIAIKVDAFECWTVRRRMRSCFAERPFRTIMPFRKQCGPAIDCWRTIRPALRRPCRR